MIQIIPANNRYFSDMWNINSYFLFSFADYFNIDNQSFWNLKVFNDDYLSSKSWFWMHPHKYYEIMTIMLSWTITHKDSLWNYEKITKNQIQVTDTSVWIMHSEFNEENESLKLYQIWVSPENMSIKPKYFTATFFDSDFKNNLFTLASWIEENKNTLISKVWVKRGFFDKWNNLKIISKKIYLYM